MNNSYPETRGQAGSVETAVRRLLIGVAAI
jgi:hypothetical protein